MLLEYKGGTFSPSLEGPKTDFNQLRFIPGSKLTKVMRLTAFLLTFFCMTASARTDAQISLTFKNEPLKKVITTLTQKAGLVFFMDNEAILEGYNISAEIRNATVSDCMALILKNLPLEFSVSNKTVFIRKKELLHPAGIGNGVMDKISIIGHLTDQDNKPVAGANIQVKGTDKKTTSDEQGTFHLDDVENRSTLVISSVSYETMEYKVNGERDIFLKLAIKTTTLNEVNVTYSTGFQDIPKERATGSFATIGNKLINRSITTNILDRITDVASGLLYSPSPNGAIDNIKIRGESTIGASRRPLVIIDNFEYEGDPGNINPNDVESVTLLKDAAASSIWGSKAGNGVIVIKTKKGKYNGPLQINVTSNFTFNKYSDQFRLPRMSVADFVEAERFYFYNGYFDQFIDDPAKPALTPLVQILLNERNGLISNEEAEKLISDLKQHDVRRDFNTYLYRNPLVQQHSVSVSGGSALNKFFMSYGFDNIPGELKRNQANRNTFNVNNSLVLFNNKVELTTGLYFTFGKDEANGMEPSSIKFNNNQQLYPYARLVDDKGEPAAIDQYQGTYLSNLETLEDWQYKPLQELQFNNITNRKTDYRANLSLTYSIIKPLKIELKYQYGHGNNEIENLRSASSYYVRDFRNAYTYTDPNNGMLVSAVPAGDILDNQVNTYSSNNIRAQVNFEQELGSDHYINVIAGGAVQDNISKSKIIRFYGYDKDNETSLPVDNVSNYYHYITGNPMSLTNGLYSSNASDRFVYGFANGMYSFKSKYTFTISARKDGSNLFGVSTNNKWVPLWSTGLKWDLDKESFFNVAWLSALKIRTSYGYNGNVDKTTASYLVARSGALNTYNSIYSTILIPPNPSLRWERVQLLNWGIDFSLVNNILSGSLDFYTKKCKDLIGPALLAPSTGVISYTGNTAQMNTEGIDVNVASQVLQKAFKWNINLLFSYSKNKVKKYELKPASNGDYVLYNVVSEGESLNSLYVYKYAGLDETGAAQGFLNKEKSKDYGAILNSGNKEDIINAGSRSPLIFGALMNTFGWKSFSLSMNIVYKFKYFFLRKSIDYISLAGGSLGHSDFNARWKTLGDEKTTNVPAMQYPLDYNQQTFYNNSSTLVEKGDHIRIRDIQMAYDVSRSHLVNPVFKSLRICLYLNNIGIIWKSNKVGVDPDAIYGVSPRLSFAGGIQVGF